MASCATLQTLALGENAGGPASAEPLADTLLASSSLTSLDFNRNDLGPEGAAEVAARTPPRSVESA